MTIFNFTQYLFKLLVKQSINNTYPPELFYLQNYKCPGGTSLRLHDTQQSFTFTFIPNEQ